MQSICYYLLNIFKESELSSVQMMRLTLGKAEKKDFNRINELFEEMLQTIYGMELSLIHI